MAENDLDDCLFLAEDLVDKPYGKFRYRDERSGNDRLRESRESIIHAQRLRRIEQIHERIELKHHITDVVKGPNGFDIMGETE